MLAQGRGVVRDEAEAAVWLGRAAEAGMTEAQVMLGELYLTGRGVPRDHQLAKSWFLRAVPAGHAGAMFALGVLHGGEHDIETDCEKARRWFAQAAEHGHPIAALICYAHAVPLGTPEPAQMDASLEAAAPPDAARTSE